MFKSKYMPTAWGLYLNYFVHGMGAIIISQNMDFLAEQWNTDSVGVASVISMIGIGRLSVLFVSGKLSDMFGRRLFVNLGIVTYIIALVGVLFSPSVGIGIIFGTLFGVANSFLDAGTYPALTESFPEDAARANTALVVFIRVGQLLLPLVISFMVATGIWFGWSFLFAAALLLMSLLYLMKCPFPNDEGDKSKEEVKVEIKEDVSATVEGSSIFSIEGISFMLYGFIAQSTFMIVQQWMHRYGVNVAGMSELSARALVSYFSAGSIAAVFVTMMLTKKFKPVDIMCLYTFLSVIATFMIWAFPTPFITTFGAFMVGFAAAGGVLQLGLSVMTEMIPVGKGMITGIFFSLGSVASFVIPLILAYIEQTDMRNIMLFNTGIAVIGFVLALIIAARYRVKFPEKV